MYSIAGETFPYRTSLHVLQALLAASVGALLKATIGHQEALVVLKEVGLSEQSVTSSNCILMAKFRIAQTTVPKT